VVTIASLVALAGRRQLESADREPNGNSGRSG